MLCDLILHKCINSSFVRPVSAYMAESTHLKLKRQIRSVSSLIVAHRDATSTQVEAQHEKITLREQRRSKTNAKRETRGDPRRRERR